MQEVNPYIDIIDWGRWKISIQWNSLFGHPSLYSSPPCGCLFFGVHLPKCGHVVFVGWMCLVHAKWWVFSGGNTFAAHLHSLKTNSLHLKIDGWKTMMYFLVGKPIFPVVFWKGNMSFDFPLTLFVNMFCHDHDETCVMGRVAENPHAALRSLKWKPPMTLQPKVVGWHASAERTTKPMLLIYLWNLEFVTRCSYSTGIKLLSRKVVCCNPS